MTDDAEPPTLATSLRRALLPALMLGLYFALFDGVGTIVVKLVITYQRDPVEFVRRTVANVLAGSLLVPAGIGEQWLRRLPRARLRDLAIAVGIVVATAPLVLVSAVGATYASERTGVAATDANALLAIVRRLEPAGAGLIVALLALALPAGVNALSRVYGVRLRWQVVLSTGAGVVMVALYVLAVPRLLEDILVPSTVAYGAMLLVAALAPLLLWSADAVERRLDQRDLGKP